MNDTWAVIIIAVIIFFLIRRGWQAYNHPSHTLGRQAANMNWVVCGGEKDADGYNDVKVQRNGLVVKISFQNKNVVLLQPKVARPFVDFIELERWLAENEGDATKSSDENEVLSKAPTALDELDSFFADFLKKKNKELHEAMSKIGMDVDGLMDNHLSVVSLKVAFIDLSVALQGKYVDFVKSEEYGKFRVMFAGRLVLRLQKSLSDINKADFDPQTKVMEIVEKEVVECEKIANSLFINTVNKIKPKDDLILNMLMKEGAISGFDEDYKLVRQRMFILSINNLR